MDPDTLRQVLRGQWLVPPSAETVWSGVGIDSRTLAAGEMFVAVRGARFDGHDFLDADTVRTAPITIVDDAGRVASARRDRATLLVDDTTGALADLAAAHRKTLRSGGCRVIAVGGSNGKTTTRHLVHTLLARAGRGTQSPRSYNNHIGVPLTLLAACPEDAFVVVEVGTNHPGEIDALGRIVCPDVAVLTSIGDEHLEFFGDVAGVAREETAIFRWLASEGLAVVPAGGPAAKVVAEAVAPFRHVARIGLDVDASVRLAGTGRLATRVTMADGLCFQLPLPGRHNVHNALSAVAVARWFGLADGLIAEALAGAEPVALRGEVHHHGSAPNGVTVLNDSYNANPDSMRVAFETLRDLAAAEPHRRRVVVLGDMFELGDVGPAAHRRLAACLVGLEFPVSCVLLAGPLMAHLAAALSAEATVNCHHFATADEDTVRDMAACIEPGDVVLVKGSRGMAMERVAKAIAARFGMKGDRAARGKSDRCDLHSCGMEAEA